MDVNKGAAYAQFTQEVIIDFPWDESAPMVQDYRPKPSRVRSISLIFRCVWDERVGIAEKWWADVHVTSSRVKKDGTPYDERLNATYAARTQLAALLSKLVAENKPVLLPEVNYSSDVKRVSE